MKKKSVTLIAAVVVLILAVGMYMLILKKGPKDEEEETEYLVTADSSDIYKYSYLEDGNTLSFTHDSEKGWKYDGDKDFAVDEEELSSLVESLWGTSISRTLEDVPEESLAEYGLDAPAAEVSYALKDGSGETFHIGNGNDTTGGIYLYKDDDTSTVYLVSEGVNSACSAKLSELEEESSEDDAADTQTDASAGSD